MRARILHPGFFKSEQLVRCSFAARLLFAGLWGMADREGRLEDRPGRIKMELFPADKVSVDTLLFELTDAGLIRPYVVDEREYLVIPAFHHWQRPHQREAASIIPSPPSTDAFAPAVPLRGEPGISAASRAVYGVGNGSPEDSLSPKPGDPGAVDRVFDAYCSTLERPGGWVRTPKRRQLVVAALKLYPLEDVVAAVTGWPESPHHRGENDRKTVYNSLELILRDAQHIEMFRDFRRHKRPSSTERTDGHGLPIQANPAVEAFAAQLRNARSVDGQQSDGYASDGGEAVTTERERVTETDDSSSGRRIGPLAADLGALAARWQDPLGAQRAGTLDPRPGFNPPLADRGRPETIRTALG